MATPRLTAPGKAAKVNDQLDIRVHDTEVLAEIEMMTNLIIATSESEGPLPQQRIDEILGVEGDVSAAPAPPAPRTTSES